MLGFAYTLPGFKWIGALNCSGRDLIRKSRLWETWSQYSLQRRCRGAESAIDAGIGGFSKVWLASSQLETAVRISLFEGACLGWRGTKSCWTFGSEDFSEPACSCTALVLTSRAGWG